MTGAGRPPAGPAVPGFGPCRLALAGSTAEKRACRDLSYAELMTDAYGLDSLDVVRPRLDDVTRHDYLMARAHGSGELVGCYRIEPDHDVSVYDNLLPAFRESVAAGRRPADVGAYIARPPGRKFRIFEGLFSLLLRVMRARGLHVIYIQVQPPQRGAYEAMGFEVASNPFTVAGWRTAWIAMGLDVETLVRGHAEAAFARRWAQTHERPLDVALWSRMCARLEEA